MSTSVSTPLVPPFTRETAALKVRKAEDNWNSRNAQQVALGYTPDSVWRNRAEFATGRDEIVRFLLRKWQRELDYRLIKELWAFDGDRIAVRVGTTVMLPPVLRLCCHSMQTPSRIKLPGILWICCHSFYGYAAT